MEQQETLSHFSHEPITKIETKIQLKAPRSKPKGLWLSVDGQDDWVEWNRAEEFIETDAQYHYRVVLNKCALIRYIRDAGELMNFHIEFAAKDEKDWTYDQILWNKVQAEYDGIIIAPYIWSMRNDSVARWYYGWDCASGCIWHADAIQRIELLRSPTDEGFAIQNERDERRKKFRESIKKRVGSNFLKT